MKHPNNINAVLLDVVLLEEVHPLLAAHLVPIRRVALGGRRDRWGHQVLLTTSSVREMKHP